MLYLWGECTTRDSAGYSDQLRCGTSGENVPLGTVQAINTSWDVVPLGRMYHWGQCRLLTPAEMRYLCGECTTRDSAGYSHQLRCGTSGENVPLGTVQVTYAGGDAVSSDHHVMLETPVVRHGWRGLQPAITSGFVNTIIQKLRTMH